MTRYELSNFARERRESARLIPLAVKQPAVSSWDVVRLLLALVGTGGVFWLVFK